MYGPGMNPRTRAAALALVVIALAACGPSPEEFREADGNGWAACYAFERADGAGGDVYRDFISSAAALGLESSTPAIRDAVDDQNGGEGGDPVIRDLGEFEDACKGAGYDF